MPLAPQLHCEPGGAFRATIETTFYAMRLAGGQKFAADLTSDMRRKLEPQYNYAVFLAAACSLLDEPFRHFEFVRQTDRERWNPAAHGAFGAWIGTGDYSVERRMAPLKQERMRTAMLAQTVITLELLAGLDAAVHSDLFNAINPERSPQGAEALVHKVVRKALDVTVDFEQKAQRSVFAPVKFDVPSAVHVALALEPQFVATAPHIALNTPEGAPSTHAPLTDPPAVPSPAATAATTTTTVSGPQLSQPLRDALKRSEAQALGTASTEAASTNTAQAAVPADSAPLRPAPIDPAAAGGSRRNATPQSGPSDDELNEVLGPGAAMIKEFFKAIAGDVAAGKAKVVWEEKVWAVQKRLIGAYGITSETLVEQLRKRSLLLRAHGNDICIVERAGRLISEPPTA
ncbi:Conjugative transfer protein TraI [Candidatus Burkholderia verschuerenii]|uniref:Conjugative transfer protein TraI n=2 Tax=Candidatus Burkholderia verschuerenii TaxID=242163 RepID=A0A0L0M5S1_9BURK|nr:Conjugative transfer protein TraI [Candidatus Burkholderia verschuerenii]